MSLDDQEFQRLYIHYFPNSSMELQNQIYNVINFLFNFLSGSNIDDLLDLVVQTDTNIINALDMLIQFFDKSKLAINQLGSQISEMQNQLLDRDEIINSLKFMVEQKNQLLVKLSKSPDQISTISSGLSETIQFSTSETQKNRYNEIVKLLISASYNPRIYLMVQEIYQFWIRQEKIVLRSEIHKKIGQDRVIAAFKQAFEKNENAIKTAQLIHQLIHQEMIGKKIWVKPTLLGIKVMAFAEAYYSRESINNRLMYALEYNAINKTKRLLLQALLEAVNPYTNSLIDKKKLASYCKIIPENIGKYINDFVKMGVMKRIPNEYGKKSYNLILFDNELVKILIGSN